MRPVSSSAVYEASVATANEWPPEALLKKLRAAYERGARLCSICSGVFVLAAAIRTCR
ncbi:MAG: Transcriptional regulator, AraC family [uncultured Paraburkholderia sp.]|nr:MAG: Transcriptional regulator, AraC family [uncultured Paraburkholderia sp.]CAH2919801.1 MAG: Transcriptional regulator, AraC family [uncultured Paraburkholderia sp.]